MERDWDCSCVGESETLASFEAEMDCDSDCDCDWLRDMVASCVCDCDKLRLALMSRDSVFVIEWSLVSDNDTLVDRDWLLCWVNESLKLNEMLLDFDKESDTL